MAGPSWRPALTEFEQLDLLNVILDDSDIWGRDVRQREL
jgi:hypothetical protein